MIIQAAADTAAVAKQTYTIAELGSAALFLFVPAMVMLKNANNRGSGAKMADSSAQWDDGDGVDTINSYQSTEGAEEYGEESTGLDLATIGHDVPRLLRVQAPITCQSGEGLKPVGRTLWGSTVPAW
jgi:hypothetical protein